MKNETLLKIGSLLVALALYLVTFLNLFRDQTALALLSWGSGTLFLYLGAPQWKRKQ